MFSIDWKGPGAAFIFLLVVFGLGWADLANKISEAEHRIRAPLQKQTDAAIKTMKDEKEAALRNLRRRSFGVWEEREHSVVYQAETDGFVSAVTDGDSPARGLKVLVGPTKDNLSTRGRGLTYDGTVCPVSEGDYWLVKRIATRSGDILVSWLPIK